MNETTMPDGLLILPRLRVQNANAISSPLTWGFPAPTAFLGFVHALEKRLSHSFAQRFGGVGIVCHRFEPQTFKPNGRQHRVFTQSRNPIYLQKDAEKFISKGTPAAIVEEGRAHLELSFVIAVHGCFDEALEQERFAQAVHDEAQSMRIAGGSVLPTPGPRMPKPEWVSWPEVQAAQRAVFARLRRRLLPGFALVHRPDLLAERLQLLQAANPDVGMLDTLLDITQLNHSPVMSASQEPEAALPPEKVDWQVERRPGWLVPLPIGYAGLSPLHAGGTVAQARDSCTPFRFVESLVSLGQWISPHRLGQLDQLLWHYQSDPEAGLYRTINRYAESFTTTNPVSAPEGA